jgi:hypothetical protein
MAIFSGTDFVDDFSIAQAFLAEVGFPADSVPRAGRDPAT